MDKVFGFGLDTLKPVEDENLQCGNGDMDRQ
jgi:hypothetical protein